MNLYTPRRENVESRPINSHTIYLATLEKETPGIDLTFKLITTLTNGKKKLYVLAHAGKYYLSNNFILGEGIANILYSSVSSKRTIKYGNQLLGI